LAEAAHALHVSPNTVHTHLQHVFRKLGVRRQAELAQLIARLPRFAEPDPIEVDDAVGNGLAVR
jgi:hypothetical protein